MKEYIPGLTLMPATVFGLKKPTKMLQKHTFCLPLNPPIILSNNAIKNGSNKRSEYRCRHQYYDNQNRPFSPFIPSQFIVRSCAIGFGAAVESCTRNCPTYRVFLRKIVTIPSIIPHNTTDAGSHFGSP